jgi:hypothetical protein
MLTNEVSVILMLFVPLFIVMLYTAFNKKDRGSVQ